MARLAPSVALGLSEATRRWPRRSTASDGALGDQAHRARVSDHNPDGRGIVHAFDLTHDPGDGVDCTVLAEMIRARKDSRVKYVIWRRRIYLGPHDDEVRAGRARPWTWFAYDGENPHTLHMHVSVGYTAKAENDVRPWYGQPKEEGFMGIDFKDREEYQDFLRRSVWGGQGEVPSIIGGNSGDDVIEAAASASRGAFNEAHAANAKADQALVAIAELRKLVENALLRLGGSE